MELVGFEIRSRIWSNLTFIEKKSFQPSASQSESFLSDCISYSLYECHPTLYEISCMVFFGIYNSKASKFHYFTAFLLLAQTFLWQFRKLLPRHYKKPIAAFNYGSPSLYWNRFVIASNVTAHLTWYLLRTSFGTGPSIHLSCHTYQ